MKRLTYLACSLLFGTVVAAMIGWSMATGNILVPVIAIPLGAIVILACRRNVREVIGDERLNKVRSQAALRTLEVAVIAGTIATIVLYSFMTSGSLSPKVTGSVYTNADGTNTMVINLYRPGAPQTAENLIRSTTIKDINSMNELEAMDYCQFRREAFLDNERKGVAGLTIGCLVASLLVTFGAFYLYYSKKY